LQIHLVTFQTPGGAEISSPAAVMPTIKDRCRLTCVRGVSARLLLLSPQQCSPIDGHGGRRPDQPDEPDTAAACRLRSVGVLS
jgi:hypothetical protein